MCYPKYLDIGEDYCFIFEQTSDPRRQAKQKGFQDMHHHVSHIFFRTSGVTENFVLHKSPSNFGTECSLEVTDCTLQGLTAEDQVRHHAGFLRQKID